MAVLRPLKNNFSQGEIDEEAILRSDVKGVSNAAAKARNVLTIPFGGFERRPGLPFMTAIPPGVQPKGFGIVNPLVDNGGTSYKLGDVVSVSGGTGIAARLEVLKTDNSQGSGAGSIGAASVNAPGAYSVAPTSPASGTGGSGTGASFSFTSAINGSSLFLSLGGTLYTAGNILTVVGGAGTAAIIQVTSVDGAGVITAFSLVDGGTYSVLPASPNSPSGGTGSGASFTFDSGIKDLGVSASGSGYNAGEILTIVGGNGVSATIVINETDSSGGITQGAVIEWSFIDSGDYTVAPTSPASVTGGTGSGAVVSFDTETQVIIKEVEFSFSLDQNYLIIFTVPRAYIFRVEDTGSGPDQLVDQFLHPYSNEEIPNIKWAVSLDVMLVSHNNHPIFQLTRTAETAWTWDTFTVLNAPSFAFGATTLDSSLNLGRIGSNYNVGNLINIAINPGGSFIFSPESVGDYVRLTGIATIDGVTPFDVASLHRVITFTSPTAVVCEILIGFTFPEAGFNLTPEEWLPEESEWTVGHGFPRAVAFYQGRLFATGSTERPSTIWGSRAGDINEFIQGSAADLGIAATTDTAGRELVTFQDIIGYRQLVIMGDSAEYFIGVQEGEGITPANFNLIRNSSIGSPPNLRPFEVGNVLVYANRFGNDFREFVFSDSEKQFTDKSLATLSNSLIRNPSDAAFKKYKSTVDGNYIWVTNGDDGSIAVLSLLRQDEITGWSLLTTKGLFENVAVLQQKSYFQVKRFVNGQNRDYIEFFDENAVFDSSVIADNLASSVSVVTGLDHLEGETVGIKVDGSLYPDQTVSAGQVTLEVAAEDSYEVGLKFPDIEGEVAGTQTLVETLPADVLFEDGSSVGNPKNINKVTVQFVNTQGFYVNGNLMPFRKFPNVMDEPIAKQSGRDTINVLLGWDQFGKIKITQRESLTMRITGLAYDVDTTSI